MIIEPSAMQLRIAYLERSENHRKKKSCFGPPRDKKKQKNTRPSKRRRLQRHSTRSTTVFEIIRHISAPCIILMEKMKGITFSRLPCLIYRLWTSCSLGDSGAAFPYDMVKFGWYLYSSTVQVPVLLLDMQYEYASSKVHHPRRVASR